MKRDIPYHHGVSKYITCSRTWRAKQKLTTLVSPLAGGGPARTQDYGYWIDSGVEGIHYKKQLQRQKHTHTHTPY